MGGGGGGGGGNRGTLLIGGPEHDDRLTYKLFNPASCLVLPNLDLRQYLSEELGDRCQKWGTTCTQCPVTPLTIILISIKEIPFEQSTLTQ